MEFCIVVLIFLSLILLCLFLHYYAKPTVYISDRKRGHSFKSKSNFDQNITFCTVCEHLLNHSQAFICEFCSVAVDKVECTKIADKQMKCKQQREKRETKSNEFKHLYVKGNINETVCRICNLEIDGAHEVGIHGTKCCWCHHSFHDSCAKIDLNCDFGELKNFVIPPFSVKAARTRGAPVLHLKEITPIPEWPEWEPLVVICNKSSGSNEADEIATIFRRLLNPIQVVNLKIRGPAEALEIVKLSPVKCRILVVGGDGTISWTLNVIQDMKLDDKVSIGICPLGTGNDLSRVLNWGSEIDSEDLHDPFALLKKIRKAETILLDRWLIEMKYDHKSSITRRLHHDKKMFMYNYCSIGVDALVTLNFHKLRKSAFYLIKSKIMNKFLYFIYGTQQIITQDCNGLNDEIELFIDDVKQDLPELQSVVVLNIDSWGAGCRLIDMIKENDRGFAESHSVSDKLVEVFGVSSSFHIAQLQVGLTKPIKLGRGQNLKIKVKKVLPIQIDGEPTMAIPCEVLITPHSQVRMLRKR